MFIQLLPSRYCWIIIYSLCYRLEAVPSVLARLKMVLIFCKWCVLELFICAKTKVTTPSEHFYHRGGCVCPLGFVAFKGLQSVITMQKKAEQKFSQIFLVYFFPLKWIHKANEVNSIYELSHFLQLKHLYQLIFYMFFMS